MSGSRSDRSDRRSTRALGPTRAERRADTRRVRALSHLERVRGQEPARRGRRRSPRAARPLAFALGALLGASLASGADWIVRDARVAAISVRGARHLAVADIAGATGVPRGAAFAAVDPAAVEERLTANGWIAGARALRLPGGRLVVGVTERVPAGLVTAEASGERHLVDAAGSAFAPVEGDPQLPLVRVSKPVELFAPDSDVAAAIALAGDLERFALPRATGISVAAADDPRGLSLTLEGVMPTIVLGRRDLEGRLRKLARLLATRPDGLGDATEIDLRFADQAVLRSEPPPEEAAQAAVGRGDAAPSENDRPRDPAVQLTGG